MKNLKNLRERESKFCQQLCLPAHNLGEVNVPTKDQLKELEANVQYLQKEQVCDTLNFSELSLSWIPAGPAVAVYLREVSVLEGFQLQKNKQNLAAARFL